MSKTLKKTNGCSGVLGAPAFQNGSEQSGITRVCECNVYFFVYASPFGRGGGTADGEGCFSFPLSVRKRTALPEGEPMFYSYSDLR